MRATSVRTILIMMNVALGIIIIIVAAALE
jgi:hypothetical protein